MHNTEHMVVPDILLNTLARGKVIITINFGLSLGKQ